MNLDDQKISIPCPHCTKSSEITIGQAKRNPEMTCRSCGTAMKIDADQFTQQIRGVEKALLDLKRTLGKLGR